MQRSLKKSSCLDLIERLDEKISLGVTLILKISWHLFKLFLMAGIFMNLML